MKKSIAKKWVAALRSGEYRQGYGYLRSGDNEFCCLGVLCNLHAQDHPDIAQRQHSSHFYLGDNIYLPTMVKEWAGVSSACGNFQYRTKKDEMVFVGKRATANLVVANDNRCTFAEIADAIEKNWKRL